MGILNKIRNGLHTFDDIGWAETPARPQNPRPPTRIPRPAGDMQPGALQYRPASKTAKVPWKSGFGSAGLPAHLANPYFDKYLGRSNYRLDPIQEKPNYQTELPIYTRRR